MPPKTPTKPALAVLPLPPLEWDVQWGNQMVRVLNFIIQQIQNPGALRSDGLTVTDRDEDTQFIINPQELTETLTIIAKNLPTSSTGLVKGQIWNDSGTLKIIP